MRKLLIIIALLVMGVAAYFSFKNGSSNQEQEVTSEKTNIASYNQESFVPLPVSEAIILDALSKYPTEQILPPEFNGKVFCSYHLYGFDEEKEKNMVYAYLWAYCEEYYQKEGKIQMGSGVSMPIKAIMELQNGVLGVHNHQVPIDGEEYANSIKEMFPESYEVAAINGIDVNTLKPSPKTQAEAFFQKP